MDNETKIYLFKKRWNEQKAFISLDLTDDEILGFIDTSTTADMAIDRAADYLLSQGLASDVIE